MINHISAFAADFVFHFSALMSAYQGAPLRAGTSDMRHEWCAESNAMFHVPDRRWRFFVPSCLVFLLLRAEGAADTDFVELENIFPDMLGKHVCFCKHHANS
jgi:hypothetical protein